MDNLLTCLLWLLIPVTFLVLAISIYCTVFPSSKDNYTKINNIKHEPKYLRQTTKYVNNLDNNSKNLRKGFKNNKLTGAEDNQRKYFPKFTKNGYKLMQLSPDLYEEIQKFWNKYKDARTAESQPWVISKYKDDNGDDNLFITLIHKDKKLVDKINKEVENHLIKWITDEGGLKWDKYHQIYDYGDTSKITNHKTKDEFDLPTFPLTHTSTYGIRTYGPNNKLSVHLDKGCTHILSAIIFVDKSDDNINWSIDVQGFEDEELKQIYMDKKLNLLLYESATVYHGRVSENPLDEYSNLYVHFKPNNWHKDY
jgi:hypothetical protein